MSIYPIAIQGDSGLEEIAYAKRVLGITPASDIFSPGLADRLRGFQLSRNLPVDGALTEETLHALGWRQK